MTLLRAAIVAALCVVATGCASLESSRTRSASTPPPTEGTGSPPHGTPVPPAKPRVTVHTGKASWYGDAHHGKKTASGEIYDMAELTAAHRSLPLGTRVRVTNVENRRSVVVRI